MKELGYIDIFFATDREEKWNEVLGRSYIRYLEPFEDELEVIEYEDLGNVTWLFSKNEKNFLPWSKEYYYASDWKFDREMFIYPEDKIYKKKSWRKLRGTETFDSLATNMDHKDFIEYLKDNGLNVCPLK